MKLVLATAIIVLVAIAGCAQQQQQTYEPSGRAVFSISDAALESVASVQLTIKNITVHNENTDKWEIVSVKDQTFDLLALKSSGVHALLGDVQLPPGKYIHILIDVSSVKVLDEDGTQDAKLPSKKLLIITDFIVEENSTTATNVDFDLDKSLHITGNNKYILTPVIKVNSHMKAEVEISSKKEVNVKSSISQATIEQSMNLQGAIKAGFELSDDIELEIDADDAVKEVVKAAKVQLPVQVTAQNQTNISVTHQNFTVRADDYILDPKEITVKTGMNVTIKFLVSADKVYYGGLDFKGPWGNSGAIAPGAAGEVSFIADENFTYTSYWPSSSARKADGYVKVE